MSYENFDIQIGLPGENDLYPVRVIDSSYGETGEAALQALPGGYDFTDLLAYLQDLIARPEDAEQLGQQLHRFLFPPAVLRQFDRSQAFVRGQGKPGLRLRLRIDQTNIKLNEIPWEYCWTDRSSFLALDGRTPMVRYIPTDEPPETISIPGTVRVLLSWANPSDYDSLDVEGEQSRIQEALAPLMDNRQLVLDILPRGTAEGLSERVRRFDPHILHFIGHGLKQAVGEGGVVLEEENGRSRPITAQDMFVLLRGTSVRLVLLNACHTAAQGGDELTRQPFLGVAPRLVAAGIPAVIGMQFAVPDRTAVTFMGALYQALADGKPLDVAVTEARIRTYFDQDDKVFWAIPVLFMRSPDGVLWNPQEEIPDTVGRKSQSKTERPGSAGEESRTGGVTITGVGQLDVGGDITGGNKTEIVDNDIYIVVGELSQARLPGRHDLVLELQKLRQTLDQLIEREEMDAEEASIARAQIGAAISNASKDDPDPGKISQRLKQAREIVEKESVEGGSSAGLVIALTRAIDMVRHLLP